MKRVKPIKNINKKDLELRRKSRMPNDRPSFT